MSNFFQAIGSGLATGAAGFLVGGPIGALAGFGIGTYSASQGMRGKSGAVGGALMGGLAGFALGGPVGALAGGLLGGLAGKGISSLFKSNEQTSSNAAYYPYGGYGNMMGGYGMGNMGMMGGYGMGNMGMMGGYGMGNMGMMGGYGMGNMGGYGMMMGSNGMMMGFACFGPMRGATAGMATQGGQLQQSGNGKPISYTTSGGYKVSVNGSTVSVTDPTGKNTVQQWGDPHEKVNGTNIKDWDGKTRTLVLGDGTKLTMNATGPTGTVQSTSIYDGNTAIQIDNNKNQITNVSNNAYQSAYTEANQADGETAYLGYDRSGTFTYTNIYNQNDDLSVSRNYKTLATGSKLWS